jgi:hypothetical protein
VRRLTNVEPPKYVPQRQLAPDSERARRALDLMRWLGGKNTGCLYEYTYDFLHFSPCRSEMYTHLRIEGVRSLLLAGEQRSACNRMVLAIYPGVAPTGETTAADEPFQRVVGCSAPRLRLVADAVIVETPEQALAAIRRIRPIDEVAVLRAAPGVAASSVAGDSVPGAAGEARVVHYSPDEVAVAVDVTARTGAWLVFASSYHPDWEATVDGAPAPLAEAYRAFPAARLSSGSHHVTFFFRRHGFHPGQWLVYFGVLAGLVLCAGCGWLFWDRSPRG